MTLNCMYSHLISLNVYEYLWKQKASVGAHEHQKFLDKRFSA